MAPSLAVARRIVLISPWVLSVAMLAPSFLGGFLVSSPHFDTVQRGLNLLFLAIDLVWIWSVYTVSIAAMPDRQRPTWIVWIFTAPIVISLVATVADLPMNNSPPAFLFFAAFLFCIGQTAVELETADHGDAPSTLGKTLGTAALLFFAPVGVWWLRQRLLRVAARTTRV